MYVKFILNRLAIKEEDTAAAAEAAGDDGTPAAPTAQPFEMVLQLMADEQRQAQKELAEQAAQEEGQEGSIDASGSSLQSASRLPMYACCPAWKYMQPPPRFSHTHAHHMPFIPLPLGLSLASYSCPPLRPPCSYTLERPPGLAPLPTLKHHRRTGRSPFTP